MPEDSRASAPDQPDEPVGRVLARMRHARGLTGAALAKAVGMSQPKISRIERGRGLPDPQDIGVLARALGASEQDAQGLMQRAERSHDRMTDWRTVSSTLASRQMDLANWERAATEIREFGAVFLPGLLQTSGYARAVLSIAQRLDIGGVSESSEAAVLAAVSERLRRQQILADRSKTFRFLIAESTLQNHPCGPAEMLAQIDHLREVSRRHYVGVLLNADTRDFPPMHGFFLIDDQVVVIDTYTTGLLSRGRKDTETHRRIFDLYEGLAVDAEEPLTKYHDWYVELLSK
jgi:transcriptional regulator with XRE-family HTH domain